MNRYDGLENVVVLVTGAARGLGAAIASQFTAQGARIVATDIDHDALAAACSRLDLEPDRLIVAPSDLADVAADNCYPARVFWLYLRIR